MQDSITARISVEQASTFGWSATSAHRGTSLACGRAGRRRRCHGAPGQNRISPDVTFALGINAMAAGSETVSESVEILGRRYPHADEMDVYERVIGDAMEGDATLFARGYDVEEAWRIVDPVLKAGTPVYAYAPHTWGPSEVDQRIVPAGGWHNPTVPG